jgi:parallel beta-helix repeat protein
MKQSIFSLLLLLSIFAASATNYYFSAGGNNQNSGTSLNSAWLTPSKLASIQLQPGDSVLFRRGDVFFGEIAIKNSGDQTHPIVISVYGDPAKNLPVLCGAVTVKGWEKTTTNNILKRKVNQRVLQYYRDGQYLSPARHPNGNSTFYASGTSAAGQLKSASITQADGYWTGATLKAHSVNWVWEAAVIKSYTQKTLYFTDSVRYQVQDGKPFYLEGKRELLDYDNEWFFDNASKELLFYSNEPTKMDSHNFQAVVCKSGISIDSLQHDIVVDGIQFDKYAQFGVLSGVKNKHIEVANCSFRNIGLAAIKFSEKNQDGKITRNNIRNVTGRAISLTECWNNEVSHNQVRAIGLIPGQGILGVNGCVGIVCELRNEGQNRNYDKFDTVAHHNRILHNFIDSCGYIGLRADGAYNQIEKNIIDHSMLTLDDGGGLYCYNKFTHGSSVKQNFVYNSSAQGTISNGIYVDNLVYDMVLDSNTVVNNAGSGLLVNAEAHDNTLQNNVLYNNGSGVCFSDWGTSAIVNNKVKGNVIAGSSGTAPCILLNSNKSRYDMAFYDYNTYIQPFSANIIQYQWGVSKWETFSQWRSSFPLNDVNSNAYTSASFTKNDKVVLFTNKSDTIRKIDLSNCSFITPTGNTVKMLELKPFSSQILISKNATICSDIIADTPNEVDRFNWIARNYDADIEADTTIVPALPTQTAVSNVVAPSCSFYPNPVRCGETVSLKIGTISDQKCRITLLDMQGKELYFWNKTTDFSEKLTIPVVPVGLYVLKIQSDEFTVTNMLNIIN